MNKLQAKVPRTSNQGTCCHQQNELEVSCTDGFDVTSKANINYKYLKKLLFCCVSFIKYWKQSNSIYSIQRIGHYTKHRLIRIWLIVIVSLQVTLVIIMVLF